MKKQEKGITLIALIITIVVLLILAVVSIKAVQDGGIITHAQDAANDYTIAKEKEEISVALSEWQIQKNIPSNTKTFKEVVENGLSKTATILGSDNGPLTITINGTENQYRVTEDGTIAGVTLLEKYILGADLQGRTATDIIDIKTGNFLDDVKTEGIDETQTIGAKFITLQQDSNEPGTVYFESHGIIYKCRVDLNSYVTDKDYGIVKVYESEEETRVGKTVKYDDKIWTILYDDNTNGLQMVSNETFLYDGSYFKLGDLDSLVTDWNTVNGVDFDGTEGLSVFEKAVYSYNNAIDTLNTACKSIVTDNDNIIDVRCVGSNPTDKNYENETLYTSENLAKWPINNATYPVGIGNKRGKSTDSNYVSDFERMIALGINIGYDISGNPSDYWLASRFAFVFSNGEVRFCMRRMNDNGSEGGLILWSLNNEMVSGSRGSNTLRPVVSLNPNIQLQECTTGEADYTF